MSIFNFFKKNKPTKENSSVYNVEDEINAVSNSTEDSYSNQTKNQIEFVDSSKLIFSSIPIQRAKDVLLNGKKHAEKFQKKFTFPLCPGMYDYSELGYIVSSWSDYHFKANKAGVACVAGGGKKKSPFSQPVQMDGTLVEGIFNVQDDIPLKPFNVISPWKIFTYDKNISALIIPAWFHSDPDFLDNFYVFPGIVDYKSFNAMNLILAPKRKMQYTIKAGDPILQVIPFYNKEIVCGYGPPNIEQESKIQYDPTYHRNQFYRKNHKVKKKFELEKIKE
jgi:hypothetical protein